MSQDVSLKTITLSELEKESEQGITFVLYTTDASDELHKEAQNTFARVMKEYPQAKYFLLNREDSAKKIQEVNAGRATPVNPKNQMYEIIVNGARVKLQLGRLNSVGGVGSEVRSQLMHNGYKV